MGNRASVLESRHVALGAGLADWNDMAVAWTYGTSTDEEHAAVREKAGLFDMTALRKVHVKGPDAPVVVDYLLPRDMTNIYVGKSGYSTVLTDGGGVADDLIVYRLGDDHFLIVYGTGETMPAIEKAAAGKNVTVELDDDLHCISLQGPKAVSLLNANSPDDLDALKYFHQTETTLFDQPAIVSRTGYSGERGYEIFATGAVVGAIWDNILEAGSSEGVLPCSFVCLNVIRIESALLFHPFDMSEEQTPWEAGLGWSVAKSKGDYIGKAACEASKGNERMIFSGIVADADVAVGEPIAGGEKIFAGGEEVGRITASLYSNRLKKSVALCYLKPGSSKIGTKVEVQGAVNCSATVSALPFYDPERLKPRGL